MKVIRVLLGTLAGALIAAMIAALHSWFTIYSYRSAAFFGPPKPLAQTALLIGGLGGFLVGTVLGIFLTLMQRGPIFGAVSGALWGLVLFLLLVLWGGMPDLFSRAGVFIAALPPLGALSGFLTSLVVLLVNPKDDSYVELHL
jgi:hypothetical protein